MSLHRCGSRCTCQVVSRWRFHVANIISPCFSGGCWGCGAHISLPSCWSSLTRHFFSSLKVHESTTRYRDDYGMSKAEGQKFTILLAERNSPEENPGTLMCQRCSVRGEREGQKELTLIDQRDLTTNRGSGPHP